MLVWTGGIDPVWIATAVLMASLPPAANVYVIARQYHVYMERATSLILVGTVVSTFTVTLLLYLIAANKLPMVSFAN